jgi:hypothetical protein
LAVLGIEPTNFVSKDSNVKIIDQLTIETGMYRIRTFASSQDHNVTCYHYTTPPCSALIGRKANVLKYIGAEGEAEESRESLWVIDLEP